MEKKLSKQAIQRMPYYLHYLKTLWEEGRTEVSAPFLAARFGLTEIQVRKDLAAVSSVQGKPKVGFRLYSLIRDIEDLLGYKKEHKAVLIGTGALGHAFLSYRDCGNYGVTVCGAFDYSRNLIGQTFSGVTVRDLEDLKDFCAKEDIHLGILAVPGSAAQSVCDIMVKAGIKAIWNFAQLHLDVPEGILVQNENMMASLAMLFLHLESENR